MAIDEAHLAEIERLAKAATPGKRKWADGRDSHELFEMLQSESGAPVLVSSGGENTMGQAVSGIHGEDKDKSFIAVADPQMVLALVEEIRRLQESELEWRDLAKNNINTIREARKELEVAAEALASITRSKQ